MRIDLDLDGDEALAHDLRGLAGRADDARPALRRFVDLVAEVEADLFTAQGGGAWDPLDPDTVARKAAAGLDPRILHETGRLRDSLTGGAERAVRITDDEVEVATTVPYARYHRRRRPPVVIGDADARRAADLVAEHLFGALTPGI